MTTATEGMEYVDVRRKWKDEALDFTPWLANNLDMLSDALGVKLKLIQTENPVGPFSCDILAKELGSGVQVAIENQLELTDHSHLGQLLTYAAGLNAGIAVWVAPDFQYEHAEALHRLNKWTRDGRRFYGVKVMVLNTGNVLGPRLCPVVCPDGWNKEITLPPGAVDPRKQQFNVFFQPLVDRLLRDGFADGAIKRFGSNDRQFASRLDAGIGYRASLEGNNDAWVTLHLQAEDKELTKLVFDKLMKDKGTIEAWIPDQEWDWRRHNGQVFSSISIRRDGSIDDPSEKLEDTRAWMLKMLPKLKDMFDQPVASMLKEMRSNSDE